MKGRGRVFQHSPMFGQRRLLADGVEFHSRMRCLRRM